MAFRGGFFTDSLKNSTVRPFLLIVLFFSLYSAYRVLEPFLYAIIFAVVLAVLTSPVQRRLTRRFQNKPTLAAGVTTLLIAAFIVLPLSLAGFAIIQQGVTVVAQVKDWLASGKAAELQQHPRVLSALASFKEYFPDFDFQSIDLLKQLTDFTKTVGERFVKTAAGILGNALHIALHFCLMLFVCFYLLRDGERLIEALKHLSPLRDEQEDRIFQKFKGVSRSVLVGAFLTAVIQALVAGLGLWIAGLPALFWGAMTGFAALVPVVGTALVGIPASLYLILFGDLKMGLFLLGWYVIVVSTIDTFFRPFLMKGGASMSPFYIFLAILGGVNIFGFAGILFGPLSIAFAMVMLSIYEEEYSDLLKAARGGGPGATLPPADHALADGSTSDLGAAADAPDNDNGDDADRSA